MGLARNVLSDHYRVKRNTQEVATDFEATPSVMSTPAPDSFAAVDEQMLMEGLFDQLEDRFAAGTPLGKLVSAVREMIAEGIDCNDYAEISRRSGIASHNVRVYFHRMAKTARALLAEGTLS